MNTDPFDWQRFHAYRVFDEFLERFVLKRKSYVTCHHEALDLAVAFDDIGRRFVADYDDSDARYEEKIAHQFKDAPEQTKIVFANVEYLWAMPVENLKPQTKRSYGERWFSGLDLLVKGDRYFFGYPPHHRRSGPLVSPEQILGAGGLAACAESRRRGTRSLGSHEAQAADSRNLPFGDL